MISAPGVAGFIGLHTRGRGQLVLDGAPQMAHFGPIREWQVAPRLCLQQQTGRLPVISKSKIIDKEPEPSGELTISLNGIHAGDDKLSCPGGDLRIRYNYALAPWGTRRGDGPSHITSQGRARACPYVHLKNNKCFHFS